MKKLWILVTSYRIIVEALARKIVQPEHLDYALFFFHPFSRSDVRAVLEPTEENSNALLVALEKAENEGRVWYTDWRSESFNEWLGRFEMPLPRVLASDERTFVNLVNSARHQIRSSTAKMLLAGGGITLTELEEAAKNFFDRKNN